MKIRRGFWPGARGPEKRKGGRVPRPKPRTRPPLCARSFRPLLKGGASFGLDVEHPFVDLLVEGELVEGHLPAVERAAARLVDFELELVAVRELQLPLLLVVAELLDDLVARLPLAGRALGAARAEPRADDAVVLR